MTRQEVVTHPVYLRLSENDQKFIVALMDNGNDKRSAAHITWMCKDDASADSMANKSLRKPSVKYLLDEYFGVNILRKIPSRDEVAAATWERAQKATDGNEFAKLVAIVNSVMGYNSKPQEAPPPEPDSTTDDDDEFV